jgi:hypothetical protein
MHESVHEFMRASEQKFNCRKCVERRAINQCQVWVIQLQSFNTSLRARIAGFVSKLLSNYAPNLNKYFEARKSEKLFVG